MYPFNVGMVCICVVRLSLTCTVINLLLTKLVLDSVCLLFRLENAFYDLAQSYYHGECRRVKAHKVNFRFFK